MPYATARRTTGRPGRPFGRAARVLADAHGRRARAGPQAVLQRGRRGWLPTALSTAVPLPAARPPELL